MKKLLAITAIILLTACGVSSAIPPTPEAQIKFNPGACLGAEQNIIFFSQARYSFSDDPTPKFEAWARENQGVIICSTKIEAFNTGKKEHFSIMSVTFIWIPDKKEQEAAR